MDRPALPLPVHWHEGLFLRPHHLQAARREVESLLGYHASAVRPFRYGLRALEVEEASVRGGRVVVRRLDAVLRDGLVVQVPGNARPLEPLDVSKDLEGEAKGVRVYLAVPRFGLGRANVGPPAGAADAGPGAPRWEVETLSDLPDETTGENPQPLDCLRLRARLSVRDLSEEGFECLPLLEVAKGTLRDAAPFVNPDYVPPTLVVGPASPLRRRGERAIEMVETKARALAELFAGRAVALGTDSRVDFENLMRLQVLNEGGARLRLRLALPETTPLELYLDLATLAAALATYGAERRLSALPPYDHDNPAECFGQTEEALRRLLEVSATADTELRPFRVAGDHFLCALEPAWADNPAARLYLVVESSRDAREVDGWVENFKIARADRLEDLVRKRLAGVRTRAVIDPPPGSPRGAGFHFYGIDRERSGSFWEEVREAREIALHPGRSPDADLRLHLLAHVRRR